MRPPWHRSGDLGRFRRQLVLTTAALGTLVAVALIVVLQLALSRASTVSIGKLEVTRSTTAINTLKLPVNDGWPGVLATQLGDYVSVFHDGQFAGGTMPSSLAHKYYDLSQIHGTRRVHGNDSYDLYARRFTLKGGATGVVVLAQPLDEYQDLSDAALVVSIAAGAVIVLLATLLAAWLSKRALAPVATMARTAEEWSEHDLERRFDLGPPSNEIRALGHTLDGLLDKVARAILAEQRLTSELAHELRSPLTAVQGTADLLAMRTDLDPVLAEDIEDIRVSCRTMAATITGLLELARAQTPSYAEARCDLRSVLDDVLVGLPDRDRVELRLDGAPSVAAPPALVARAVAPVLENAVRLADHVVVTAQETGQRVHVRVSDDGPGVPADDAGAIFRPGHTDGAGSGLGLALARRIARSVGGDVTLDSAGSAGATFVITFARA